MELSVCRVYEQDVRMYMQLCNTILNVSFLLCHGIQTYSKILIRGIKFTARTAINNFHTQINELKQVRSSSLCYISAANKNVILYLETMDSGNKLLKEYPEYELIAQEYQKISICICMYMQRTYRICETTLRSL